MDRSKLCLHIESLLEPLMDIKDYREKIQKYIGRLTRLNDDDFLNYCKELKIALYTYLNGDQLDPKAFSHIPFSQKEYARPFLPGAQDGTVCYGLPRDEIFEILSSLGPTQEQLAYKIAAGMMRLKSAILPRKGKVPSLQDRLKYTKSITGDFTGDVETLIEVTDLTELYGELVAKRYKEIYDRRLETVKTTDNFYYPFIAIPPTDKSFTTIIYDIKGAKTRLLSRKHGRPYNLLLQTSHPLLNEIYRFDPLQYIGRTCLGYTPVFPKVGEIDVNDDLNDTPLITIFPIPEPGRKERVVAVPCAVLQSLTYPIGKVTRLVLDTLWNQGVKSHEGTTLKVSSYLKGNLQNYLEGKNYTYVNSIDMSDYTDRMPKELSAALLRGFKKAGIVNDFDLKAFDVLSRAKINIDGKVSTYTVGTPMGTFPSFPLASLANGAVAWLAELLSIVPDPTFWLLNKEVAARSLNSRKYLVIGDDIVILDDKIAMHYKELMTNLGVEVQPNKCVRSIYLAEMCSKLITHTGVYQQKKVDKLNLDSIGNIISNFEYYDINNTRLLDSLNDSKRALVEDLLNTPKPYGFMDIREVVDETDHTIWTAFIKSTGFAIPSISKMDLEYLNQRKSCIQPFLDWVLYSPLNQEVETQINDINSILKQFNQEQVANLVQIGNEIAQMRGKLINMQVTEKDIDKTLLFANDIIKKVNYLETLCSAIHIEYQMIKDQNVKLTTKSSLEQEIADQNDAIQLTRRLRRKSKDHDDGPSM